MGSKDDVTQFIFPKMQTRFRNIQMWHSCPIQDVLSPQQGCLSAPPACWRLFGLCNGLRKPIQSLRQAAYWCCWLKQESCSLVCRPHLTREETSPRGFPRDSVIHFACTEEPFFWFWAREFSGGHSATPPPQETLDIISYLCHPNRTVLTRKFYCFSSLVKKNSF